MSSPAQKLHFLNPPEPLRRRSDARFHVLPVPYEGTVSYGGGTAAGPGAILAASSQVELFNGLDQPVEQGIFTWPLPEPVTGSTRDMIEQVKKDTMAIIGQPAIPVILGGEHMVTLGALKALRETAASGESFGIVQFDAHADLRGAYEGNPLSHACVMRRAIDLGIPLIQFGVRSLCREEAGLRKQLHIPHHDAVELKHRGLPEPTLPADFPESIYISFDLDCLDSSLMPATGTPEPGGLFWYETLTLLERVITGRRVIGLDVVELAPINGLHAPDFTAAKLVYAMIGLIVQYGVGIKLKWRDEVAAAGSGR